LGGSFVITIIPEDSAYEATKELLAKDDYSAFFVASSKMLHGALKAFREAKKKIPEDISVIGVDVADPYDTMFFSITSILQSERKMGQLCSELLLNQMKNENTPKTYHVPFTVTEKNSIKKL